MINPGYVASPRFLSTARKALLVALVAAGEEGMPASAQHSGALLAGLVSLGWVDRCEPRPQDARASVNRFRINQAGRDVLATAKKGRAG
jgi:hypothetical protein